MKKQFIHNGHLLLLFALAITPAALLKETGLERVHECTWPHLSPARQSALPESFSTSSTGEMHRRTIWVLLNCHKNGLSKGKTYNAPCLVYVQSAPCVENGYLVLAFRSVNKLEKRAVEIGTYNFSVMKTSLNTCDPTFDAF